MSLSVESCNTPHYSQVASKSLQWSTRSYPRWSFLPSWLSLLKHFPSCTLPMWHFFLLILPSTCQASTCLRGFYWLLSLPKLLFLRHMMVIVIISFRPLLKWNCLYEDHLDYHILKCGPFPRPTSRYLSQLLSVFSPPHHLSTYHISYNSFVYSAYCLFSISLHWKLSHIRVVIFVYFFYWYISKDCSNLWHSTGIQHTFICQMN